MPIPPQVVKCYKYIDSKEKNFINELRQLIKIPNISSDPTASGPVDTAVEWMRARLVRTGFKVEMRNIGIYVPDGQTTTAKIPTVILATLGNDRKKKCLLYYCHLDVFRVEFNKWETDPFTLNEKNGKFYGRGTAKMKGPLLCFLHAVDTYQALGMDMPINVKIICESMNECKSIGIAEMLQNLRTGFLSNIDCMLMTDGQWTGPAYACILYAFRGVCYFNLTIEGLAEDLNSGEYGGVVQEPLQDLIYILNRLVDSSGALTIPGLDRDMMQVTPEEEKIYSHLKIDMEEYRKDSGLKKLAHDGDRSKTLMHAWRYPSFNLHYVNAFPPCECPVNLSIPKKVHARFSIRYYHIRVVLYLIEAIAYANHVFNGLKRIVSWQTPEMVCRLICDHLNTVLKERNSPNKAKLLMEESLRPWMEDHHHWNYEAAKTASKQVYKDQVNLVREGNAYKSLLEFEQIMPKTNILLLPLVNSEANIHKEEENISSRCYSEGTKLLASYFYNLSVSQKG